MTAWQRDLTALELWHRSFEGSRRRRAVVPRLRRQAARRKRASTAVAAAVFAGPAAQATAAPSSRLAPGHIAIAGEQVDRPSTRLSRPQYVLLHLGSTGEAVVTVQRRLRVEDDGHYGPKTEHAVRTFQGTHGLKVDGVVGPKTWRALFGGGREAHRGVPGSSASQHSPTTARSERRASFAVRRASEDELERLDRRNALPRPRDRSAALAAIELRMPALKPGEKSSAAGEDGGSESSSRKRATRGRERGSRESSADSGSRRSRAIAAPPRETSPATASGSCGETLKWPTTATNVSSGHRTSLRPSHAGIDIDGGLSDEGNPVYAAACGIITLMQGTSESGGYGNFVCVKHTDRFVTCYAHLSRFSDVSTGDYVRRGEVIGAVGNTGHSFGAHLHFETRRGTPYRDPDYSDFDPLPYLNGLPIPGDPVAPPSGGVGGPNLGEPEPEPRSSMLAQRPRATGQAPTGDLGADRAADGLEASDTLEEGVWRRERAAASVSEVRSSRAILGAANGGHGGVSGQDEGVAANRQERAGSHHVRWGASTKDQGNASPQEGSGASPPGQDGPDSGVGDAHAAPSPDVQDSVGETPDPGPLEEAPDDQPTGTEAESAPPDDPRSGGAQVVPDTGDSPGTTGAAAGELPGGGPGATDHGVGDRSQNRPADDSASRPGNGSQGADGTMEESSGGESLESDTGARRWANHSGSGAGSARAGFTGDEPGSQTPESSGGRVADTESPGASHANEDLESDGPHGEPRMPDEDRPAGERSRRDPENAEA